MPPMPTSTTGTANAVTTRKDGRIPPLKMVNARPFVVSSVSTKRYAPAKKPLVPKLPPIPPPASTKERSSVPRASRPGSLPTVVPKAEPRRGFPKPLPIPVPNKTTKVQKPPPSPLVPSAGRSLHEKTFAPKPLKIVQRLREGKLLGGCSTPAPATRRSTQVTIADELPPRPCCVPRARIYVSVLEGTQDATVKVSTAGPRNPGISRQKPSVNVAIVGVVDTSVDSPVVAGGCRAGTLTRNRRLTGPKPIVYPQVVKPMSYVAWSASSSPDLSSFPSQSWTVVVDVEVQQIKTPTATICGDESPSSMGDTPKSVVAGTPNDSCGASEVVFSPLSLSPSSTVIETLESPAKSTVGSDGDVAMISSPTKVPSAEVPPTVCAATIVSPSRNGITSMDSLVKVMASSHTQALSDAENRTRMSIQCAIVIAKSFSPSRRAAQSSTETVALETNVSRIRKLFTPQLDEDVLKASKNPMTQMEIEQLRAQKKVAGGGVVDARLDRLDSLAAMAIVTKRLGTSGPESPSQV
ncbi:hypothetical protein OG21DRAFT_1484487 [Imleria badia]|nr:hypothetical protein OG21DRAFT_1484487 [Imleria badia]